MKTLAAALALTLLPAASMAAQVTDNFESGTNPNQWGWTNNGGGSFIIEMTGGNPGAWLDSGTPYFSDHPNLTSVPPKAPTSRPRSRAARFIRRRSRSISSAQGASRPIPRRARSRSS